jgi:hypothetical protein
VENQKALRYGGLALLGVGGFLMLRNSSQAAGPGPTPKPGPKPPPAAAPGHWLLRYWLQVDVATGRVDVFAGFQQGRYKDVIGQFLREQWSDFLARGDVAPAVAAGDWYSVVGQWLKEHDPGFWYRGDIAAAWAGGQRDAVFGQYLREQGSGIAGLPAF